MLNVYGQLLFQDQTGKKIKTESGVWIPASYKSDRYAKGKERSKVAQMQEEDQDGDETNSRKSKIFYSSFIYWVVGTMLSKLCNLQTTYSKHPKTGLVWISDN